MLTDLEAREALHVLLLSRLSQELRPDAFVLKGGVNLRLFFDSPRYSEDIDLDIDPSAKDAIMRAISVLLASRWLVAQFESLGIERVDFGGKPASTLIRLFDSSWRSSTTVEFACPRESRRPSVIDLREMQ